jgi:hypothetical protein
MNKRFVMMNVYEPTRNRLKSAAALQGKTLVDYLDEISKKEAEKIHSEEKVKRRFGGEFF